MYITQYPYNMYILWQGCILNFKFIFLPSLPFLIHVFPQMKFILMRGCAPEPTNCQPFSPKLLGKKYAKYLPIGEKYEFSPFFHPFSFFNHIFSTAYYLAILGLNIKICTSVLGLKKTSFS